MFRLSPSTAVIRQHQGDYTYDQCTGSQSKKPNGQRARSYGARQGSKQDSESKQVQTNSRHLLNIIVMANLLDGVDREQKIVLQISSNPGGFRGIFRDKCRSEPRVSTCSQTTTTTITSRNMHGPPSSRVTYAFANIVVPQHDIRHGCRLACRPAQDLRDMPPQAPALRQPLLRVIQQAAHVLLWPQLVRVLRLSPNSSQRICPPRRCRLHRTLGRLRCSTSSSALRRNQR